MMTSQWRYGLFVVGMGISACSAPVTPTPPSVVSTNSTKPSEIQPCELATELRARVPRLLQEGKLHRTERVIEKANRLCPATAKETWAEEVEVASLLGSPGKYSNARRLIQEISASANAPETAKAAAKKALEWVDRFDKPWPPKEKVTPEMRNAWALAVKATDDKKFAEAIDLYEKAWEAWPLNATALFNSGKLSKQLGKTADGQRFFDRSVAVMEGRTGQQVRGEFPSLFRRNARSIAWSPSSGDLAAAYGNVVVIYDLSTLHEQTRMEGPDREVVDLAFSPDGKRIASTSADSTVREWDVETSELLNTFTDPSYSDKTMGGGSNPEGVIYSPDGAILGAVFPDADNQYRIARLWKTSTGEPIGEIKGYLAALAFSRDGKKVHTLGWDNWVGMQKKEQPTFRIWDVATGKTISSRSGPPGDSMRFVFSPDAKLVCVERGEHSLELWNAVTGRLLGEVQEPTYFSASPMAFSPNGSQVIARGKSPAMLRIWDTTTRKIVVKLEGHENEVNALAFSPDGRRVASAARDQTIRFWDSTSGKLISTLGGEANDTSIMAFSLDGRRLAWRRRNAWQSTPFAVNLWEVSTEKRFVALKGNSDELASHLTHINDFAFSPDGKFIASTAFDLDGPLALWDTRTGEYIRGFQGHSIGAGRISFSPDGKRLVSGSTDKTVRLWDVASGAEVYTLKGHAGPISAVAVSPDGTRIVSGSKDKTVRVWDASTGKLLHTLEEHTHDVASVAFSPDGRRIASGSVDASVILWDAVRGNPLRTAIWREKSIRSVAFSADGKLIAAGANSGEVRLWDANTGAIVGQFEGHVDSVTNVAFLSSDMLRSGSSDGEVRYWRLSGGTLLAVQKPINGKDALVHVTADHHVDFVGADACSAKAMLRCRIGGYSFPFDICEERSYVPGILAKMLDQDASYLEPEFDPPPMSCNESAAR